MKKLLIAGLLLLFVFVGATAKPKTTDAKPKATKATTENKEVTEDKEVEADTPQELIEKFSKDILDEKHYRDIVYLPKPSVDSEIKGIVTINSDFHDSLTHKMINQGECDNAFKLAKKIFTDDTFNDIDTLQYCVWGVATDVYGNKNDQIAIKIFISRDTFSKFNLDSEEADFFFMKLPDLADYYQTDFK